jgi:hypothetical protein
MRDITGGIGKGMVENVEVYVKGIGGAIGDHVRRTLENQKIFLNPI